MYTTGGRGLRFFSFNTVFLWFYFLKKYIFMSNIGHNEQYCLNFIQEDGIFAGY